MKLTNRVARIIYAASVLLMLAGCEKDSQYPAVDEGYQVESYNAQLQEWVIAHHGTWATQRMIKRYWVRCRGSKDEKTGEHYAGCSLPVGSWMPADIMKLQLVGGPDKKLWWTHPNRQPLFVVDLTNMGLLTVIEESNNTLDSQLLLTNHFVVVKSSVTNK